MSPSKALALGCISIIISGCQSWQFRDVDSLPPTAALPEASKPGIVHTVYWNNVSGNKVSSLTSLDSYPDNPVEVLELAELRGPINRTDNYGSLTRGYIIPSTEGSYRFFVSGDDETQLWLSTSINKDEARLIASVPGASSPDQFNKYPAQTSAPQDLKAGSRYYFEVIHKEGSGGDHFSVAWEGPNTAQQVIGSNNLASLGPSLYPDDQSIRTAYSLGYRVGFLDGSEGLAFNPGYPPSDDDQDGLYDNWEIVHGLNPANQEDAFSDPDGDLLSAADEFLMGTAENNPDMDGDGIPDGAEFAYGLEPLDPSDASLDSDGDGFSNLAEYLAGSSMDDPEDIPKQELVYLPGFVGQYYSGISFNKFVTNRHDLDIDFTWSRDQPHPELPVDKFSVRWNGIFTAPHISGTRQYEFISRTDDGLRLSLDRAVVINEWRDMGPTTFSHTAFLNAQESIQLGFEYYENLGGAVAELIIKDLSTGETIPLSAVVKVPNPSDDSLHDTDGDGIPDTWELRHGLNPWINDGAEISNSEGVSNLEAYTRGVDPWTLEPVPTPNTAPESTQPSAEETFPSADGVVTLSWTAPLTRMDGSSISLSEIDSYRIYYGQNPDDFAQSVTVDGSVTSKEIAGLEPGIWYFAIQVIDTNGLTSPLSEPEEHSTR